MKHSYKYEDSDELWLVIVYWQVENYFHAEFAKKKTKQKKQKKKRKNPLDERPEMFLNRERYFY